jgi:hypothetical protein
MPKRRRPSPKKHPSQHAKFVEAARRLGIDEGEEAFKGALKKIAPATKKAKPTNV